MSGSSIASHASWLLAVAAAMFGCDTALVQPDIPDAAPISPQCAEAQNHDDLPWLEENVFRQSCAAFNACHKGLARQAEGLNLEPGNVETNLVDQPSTLFPEWTLVTPGDPSNSYLLVVLGHIDGPLSEAGTMPYNNPLLCKQKREAVERWIQSLSM